MSCGVIGIDFGSESSVVGYASKGQISIALNDFTNRKTPSYVGFTNKQRNIGDSAVFSHKQNWRNTIYNLKNLIGKNYSDKSIAKELNSLVFSTVQVGNDNIGVKVLINKKETIVRVESLIAMLFTNLKTFAESSSGVKVAEAVVAVPIHFTVKQRLAIIAAAEIAGLKVPTLISEPAAIALCYGANKTFEKSSFVFFIDVGHNLSCVSVVCYQGGKFELLRSNWSFGVCGEAYTAKLLDFVIAKIIEKFKIDPRNNVKSMLRLKSAVEKAKCVLSANKDARIYVDSLSDDVDVSIIVERSEFEKATESLTNCIVDMTSDLIKRFRVENQNIHAIEIVGGGSRVPSLKKAITEHLGLQLNETLDADESVAKGATIRCAMASPLFKVRELEISDCFPYEVVISWGKVTDDYASPDCVFDESTLLFKKFTPIPSAKLVSFIRSEPFQVVVSYSKNNLIPPGTKPFIARYVITPKESKNSRVNSKTKVKIALDSNGVIVMREVSAFDDFEIEAETREEGATAKGEGAKEEAEATNGTENEQAKAEASVPKKRKTVKTSLPYTTNVERMTREEIQREIEFEAELTKIDQVFVKMGNLKNGLETMAIKAKPLIQTEWRDYLEPEQAQELLRELDSAEDFIYSEDSETTDAVYELRKRFDSLSRKCNGVESRLNEHKNFSPRLEALKDMLRNKKALLCQAENELTAMQQKEAEMENEIAESESKEDEANGKDENAKKRVAELEALKKRNKESALKLSQISEVLIKTASWTATADSRKKETPLWKDLDFKVRDIENKILEVNRVCKTDLMNPDPEVN